MEENAQKWRKTCGTHHADVIALHVTAHTACTWRQHRGTAARNIAHNRVTSSAVIMSSLISVENLVEILCMPHLTGSTALTHGGTTSAAYALLHFSLTAAHLMAWRRASAGSRRHLGVAHGMHIIVENAIKASRNGGGICYRQWRNGNQMRHVAAAAKRRIGGGCENSKCGVNKRHRSA